MCLMWMKLALWKLSEQLVLGPASLALRFPRLKPRRWGDKVLLAFSMHGSLQTLHIALRPCSGKGIRLHHSGLHLYDIRTVTSDMAHNDLWEWVKVFQTLGAWSSGWPEYVFFYFFDHVALIYDIRKCG